MNEAGAASGEVAFRPLASAADYAACAELQKATWGQGFAEVVPGVVLKICQKVGGVAAGAFDREGRMLGFVFGVTGVRHGRLAHWSHMLAVRPEARDLGLGRSLKLYQREQLLALGVEQVLWTYDPLESRNAHLNFNRLGVEVEEYVVNMYDEDSGSELSRGLGTDRFIVSWEIAGERARRVLGGEPPDFAPFRAAPAYDALGDAPPPEAPRVRVAIPASIQDVKHERPEEAAAWRAGTRRALQGYLARGYRAVAFGGDPCTARGWYGLERVG
jgi:predicted GNAT superfamily acetyltransferase